MAHRIRLAGPWEARSLSAAATVPNWTERCQLPIMLSEVHGDNGIVLSRKFHCPTGIDQATGLKIICRSSEESLIVRLNGEHVPADEPCDVEELCFDITGKAKPFNELSVVLRGGKTTGASLDCVWLEIAD